MRITRIELQDVFSFDGEQEVEIPEEGLFLVKGIVDGDEERSAGAGKTSLFEAISWALFDRVGKNVSKDDLIRIGQDYCRCRVDLDTGMSIVRQRGKTPGVAIFNKGQKRPLTTKFREAQDILPKVVGMSFNLWSNAVYYAQDFIHDMVSGTNSSRQVLAGEILSFEVFRKAEEITKGHKREIDKSILSLEGRLEEARKLAKTKQLSLEKVESKKRVLRRKLKGLPDINISEEEENLRVADEKRDASSSALIGITSQLVTGTKEAKDKIAKLSDNKCPTCWRVVDEETRRRVRMGLEEEIQRLSEEKDKAEADYQKALKARRKITKALSLKMAERNKVEEKRYELNLRLREVQAYTKGIKVSKMPVGKYERELDRFERGSDALGTVRSGFEKVRGLLYQRFLPLYIRRVNRYISFVSNGSLSVQYEDGEFHMLNRGRDIVWGSFSGGEKRLFNAVFTLALGNVLREQHTTFSQLYFDELLAQMDVFYIRQMLDFLKTLVVEEHLGIFIATNQQSVVQLGNYDAVFEVVNEGGVSKIVRSF